jgi:HSP20 family protein
MTMSKHKDVEVKKGNAPAASEPNHALSPFEEMDRVFDSLWRHRWPRLLPNDWPGWTGTAQLFDRPLPKVDVLDLGDQLVVNAELPGVDRNDLDVSILQNQITIKGRTARDEQGERGEYFHREISRGEFQRTVILPADVDAEKARGRFENGLLTISLPKLKPVERHSIEIA